VSPFVRPPSRVRGPRRGPAHGDPGLRASAARRTIRARAGDGRGGRASAAVGGDLDQGSERRRREPTTAAPPTGLCNGGPTCDRNARRSGSAVPLHRPPSSPSQPCRRSRAARQPATRSPATLAAPVLQRIRRGGGVHASAASPAFDPCRRRAMTFIRRFDELGKGDVAVAGGKGANLGEMARAGLPVPPGFVITVDAYARFFEASGVAAEVSRRLERLDVDDPVQLRRSAESSQAPIRRARVPDDVRAAILDAYRTLSEQQGAEQEYVAVRSSATVEDTAQFSFAGMFESFLNIRGGDALIRRVKDCWASSFGARVLFYRIKQGLLEEAPIAVIVQKMVNA